MVNAKECPSSCQLARHLDLNQGSTWSMMQRIRTEMARKEKRLLQGIIKADETYIGGKPRRRKNDDGKLPPPSKRGTDMKKTPIIDERESSKQPSTQLLIAFSQN